MYIYIYMYAQPLDLSLIIQFLHTSYMFGLVMVLDVWVLDMFSSNGR